MVSVNSILLGYLWTCWNRWRMRYHQFILEIVTCVTQISHPNKHVAQISFRPSTKIHVIRYKYNLFNGCAVDLRVSKLLERSFTLKRFNANSAGYRVPT